MMYGGGMDPLIGLGEEDYRAIREKDKEDSYERRISSLEKELKEEKSNHELYKRVLQYVINLNKKNNNSLLFALESFDKFFDYVKSNIKQEYVTSSTFYNIVEKLLDIFLVKNRVNTKLTDKDKEYFRELLYLQACCYNNSDVVSEINRLYRIYRYEIRGLKHESQEILDAIKYSPPTEENGKKALQTDNEFIYKWADEGFRDEVVMNMGNLTGDEKEVKEKLQRIKEISDAAIGIINIERRQALKKSTSDEINLIYRIFEDDERMILFR